MNSELRNIYVSRVWSHHNQLFTMHHSGYYNLVSFIFGTTIPTSSNILMKCFLHLLYIQSFLSSSLPHIFLVALNVCIHSYKTKEFDVFVISGIYYGTHSLSDFIFSHTPLSALVCANLYK